MRIPCPHRVEYLCGLSVVLLVLTIFSWVVQYAARYAPVSVWGKEVYPQAQWSPVLDLGLFLLLDHVPHILLVVLALHLVSVFFPFLSLLGLILEVGTILS